MLTRCTNNQHALETDSVCDLCWVPRCSSMYHRAYLYKDKSLYMFTLSMRGLLIPFYLMSVCMHLVTIQARRIPVFICGIEPHQPHQGNEGFEPSSVQYLHTHRQVLQYLYIFSHEKVMYTSHTFCLERYSFTNRFLL